MSLKTLPRWDCNHIWRPVSAPYSTWTSIGTLGDAPKNCPTWQEHKCELCGGHEVLPVMPNAT